MKTIWTSEVDLGLADSAVLVAGSSRGIGLSIADAFLREGARVMITGRSRAGLKGSLKELRSANVEASMMACGGDLADRRTIRRCLNNFIENWGPPKCLVANIGSGAGDMSATPGDAEWDRGLMVNLTTTVRIVEEVLPKMAGEDDASIVMIGSIAGLAVLQAPLPYSAAKAALINYCRNLAGRAGSLGVRVNVVAPGNVLFPGGSWERKLRDDGEGVSRYIREHVPVNRFATPSEIADVVVFLSSPRAAFVTGACIVVDGGQTARVD